MSKKMRLGLVWQAPLLVWFLSVVALPVQAQGDFYRGKTLTVLVGYAPGGGVDLAARLVAQFLPKHIPGQPTVVVMNRPGAGGVVAANLLYSSIAPDGLTIGIPGRSEWLLSAVRKESGVRYDPRRFEWIGGIGDEDDLIVVSKAVVERNSIRSIRDLEKLPEPIVFGSGQKTGNPYVIPQLLRRYLRANVNVLAGYSGSGEVLLAFRRREIQALALPYSTVTTYLEDQLRSGEAKVLAKIGHRNPPISGAEQLLDLLPLEARQLLTLLRPGIGVAVVMPPGTDQRAVQVIRQAFRDLSKDPEFLRVAKQRRVLVNYVDAEEALKIVGELMATEPHVVDELRKVTSGQE